MRIQPPVYLSALLVLILLFSGFTKQSTPTEWVLNFETAKTQATAEGKLILMSFSGLDWCSNCMRLDKILFQSAKFQEFAQSNLVLLQFDFPSKRKNRLSREQTRYNEKMAEKFNPGGVFPTVILFDSDGNRIGKMPYPATTDEAYINGIKSLMANRN